MVEMRLKGVHGTALSIDDEAVTFHAKGVVTRGALGALERRIPLEDITDRSFKPANLAVNGRIEVVTANGKSVFYFMTGSAARAAHEGFDLIVQLTPRAGTETTGRGFTQASGVEGATMREVAQSTRDILARDSKNAMGALKGYMRDMTDRNIFVGLRFDSETATYLGVTQPIAGATAVVDTSGSLSRRPTLTRVAMGKLLLGSIGAIGGGLVQKRVDGRQVFILIDGPEAAWAVPVQPDQYGAATQFAALFNTAAKAAAATQSAEPSSDTAPRDLTERLVSLANLHAQGLLSDEEFALAKARALEGN